MSKNIYNVTFTSSTDSAPFRLENGGFPLGIVTPASFGATTISFLWSLTETGTYIPVNDEAGSAISITVSSTAAGVADLTNVFPASIARLNGNERGWLKLKAGSSITKTAQVIAAD